MSRSVATLPPYRQSLSGALLAAREAVMAPIRPMLRAMDVTEQQWRVLRVLNDLGPLDPSGLSQAAQLHAPSVTRILKELVDRELVVREHDSHDRRRSIVTLSDKGATLIHTTVDHTIATLEIYRARFGAERLEALAAELRALAEVIGNAG
ncbi:MarR family transcriptional regulator [uncultured Sphingomonas sp.]|uniref:MarR family transcriptional regulator n=1 Tax=uncultured Sphingomonas sp. TaxID=158754 RepID=UPI00261029B4|nr:MarR family transcriptional regulator [uncultured Sphingomonas sp.]